MRKQLKSVENSFGHLGECRFRVYPLIEPLRTRWAWSCHLETSWEHEGQFLASLRLEAGRFPLGVGSLFWCVYAANRRRARRGTKVRN